MNVIVKGLLVGDYICMCVPEYVHPSVWGCCTGACMFAHLCACICVCMYLCWCACFCACLCICVVALRTSSHSYDKKQKSSLK